MNRFHQLHRTKLTIQKLLESKFHLGNPYKNIHPLMRPYLSGVVQLRKRDEYKIRNVYRPIFNLELTLINLRRALKVVEFNWLQDSTILFVTNRGEYGSITKKVAKSLDQPYVAGDWVNGLLTNWYGIARHMIEFRKKLNTRDGLAVWRREKQIKSFNKQYDGLLNMRSLPDLIIFLDGHSCESARKEALNLQIPTISLMNSNMNPEDATYVIPSNDSSIETITTFLGLVEETCRSKEILEKKLRFQALKKLQLKKKSKSKNRRKISRKNKK